MKPNFDWVLLLLCGLLLSAVQGCSQHHSLKKPTNPTAKLYGSLNQSGDEVHHMQGPKASEQKWACDHDQDNFAASNYQIDKPIKPVMLSQRFYGSQANDPLGGFLPLSSGDLLNVLIEDGEGFSGNYVIDANGFLRLPHVQPILAHGKSLEYVEQKIELSLTRSELFRPETIAVHLQVMHLAEIEVAVSGAVFSPGRARINVKSQGHVIDDRVKAAGDYSSKRLLSEAIRAASGVRPDAKLDQVIVIRDGWRQEVDLSGILTGELTEDMPLISGDQVLVPSTGCFQRHLVRPSQITPKGFRVFLSNLTDSADSNASAAVGRYSSNVPYGTRLLQAAVSANCVGGKQWTNAPRKVVLASKNPLTGQFQVIERSVEQIMRQAHIDDINPYLMPNDAVACYDSDVTNLRDIAQGFAEIALPIKLFF